MKITSFNPLILTKNVDSVMALFETMGFEKRHKKTGINDKNITSVSMKDPNGFKVDVASVEKMPRDMIAIRMNVDDFDEAYNFLLSRGFVNAQGDNFTDTGSSKATLMVSPSGFAISLAQHVKK